MQIKDFPLITSINDNDLFLIQTNSDKAYKAITAKNLQSYFGNAGGSSGITGTLQATLTYSSDGDSNGLVYWLGTSKGTASFSNPSSSGQITTTMSSIYNNLFSPSEITNRSGSNTTATSSVANSYYQIAINNYTLKPNYYSIRARNYSGNLPNSWSISGSNDGAVWDVLHSVASTQLTQSQWYSHAITSSRQYKYFRVTQTSTDSNGSNYFCLGQIEFYGSVYQ